MTLKEIGFVFLFLAAWIVLNRWVLPWLGISTCMSGGCSLDSRPAARERGPDQADDQHASREGAAPNDSQPSPRRLQASDDMPRGEDMRDDD